LFVYGRAPARETRRRALLSEGQEVCQLAKAAAAAHCGRGAPVV